MARKRASPQPLARTSSGHWRPADGRELETTHAAYAPHLRGDVPNITKAAWWHGGARTHTC
eukprot:12549784-Alexandrium_andersonii.AAC.1